MSSVRVAEPGRSVSWAEKIPRGQSVMAARHQNARGLQA
jgi:hypothetical protein